jgi:ribosomal protein L7Ae-like RNA K-turn-binding protein
MKANIKSYIGFSVKKGSVVFGLESLERYKKRIYLLMLCLTAQNNTTKKIQTLAEKRNIPLLTSDEPLDELVNKTNLKVIGFTDEGLAKTIIKHFEVSCGGTN